MRSDRVLLPVVLVLATTLPAQAPDMGPAKELGKYDKLLGHWEGKGSSPDFQGGAARMHWNATSSYKKVLGGHWIQENTRVVFDGTPGVLVFRSLHGWDGENKRYVIIEVNNMGGVSLDTMHWAGDNAMVTSKTHVQDGQVVVERWVTKIDGDKLTFASHRAIGSGELEPFISGSAKRSTTAPKAIDGEGSYGPPVAAEMDKLKKLAGSYRFKGSMEAMPGIPAMEISGEESLNMIWGGTVCEVWVKGDPMAGMEGMPPYAAWGAIGWSAQHRCYIHVSVSSMGHVGTTEGRWIDGDFVFTGAMLQMGKPAVSRMVLACSDKGITSVVGHSIIATNAPSKSFSAKYVRKDKN